MLINYDIPKHLRVTKDKGKVAITTIAPKTIVVNKFTEESAKQFMVEFAAAVETGQEVIPIIIDSYGGGVYSLLSMIDVIKTSPVPVATIVTGKAMSCGAVLFTCGTEGMRYISNNSTLMVHDVASGTRGKLGDMEITVKEARRLNQLIFRVMEDNIGVKRGVLDDIIEKKNRQDWYLTSKQAKVHKLANHIGVPTLTVSVSVTTSFE